MYNVYSQYSMFTQWTYNTEYTEDKANFSIRLIGGFLCSSEHSKVSLELLKGRRVTLQNVFARPRQGVYRATRYLFSCSKKPCHTEVIVLRSRVIKNTI